MASTDDLLKIIEWMEKTSKDVSTSLEEELQIRTRINPNGDFSNANLQSFDLSGANLDRASLEAANLSSSNLLRVSLRRTDLRGAHLSGAVLRAADLRDARLKNARLKDVELIQGILYSTDLTGAKLSGAQLKVNRFERAYLSGASLHGTNLTNANLVDARFQRARLEEARLTTAEPRSDYPIYLAEILRVEDLLRKKDDRTALSRTYLISDSIKRLDSSKVSDSGADTCENAEIEENLTHVKELISVIQSKNTENSALKTETLSLLSALEYEIEELCGKNS